MSNLLYNLAQPFSNTKQYTQGAIVIYNDRMYEMTADEYTPGPFDPEKFTERFLSEMISGKLNSNLMNGVELLATVSSTASTTVTVPDLSKYSEVLLAMEGVNDKILQAGKIMTYEEFKSGSTIVLDWYNENKLQTRGSFTYISDTSVAMYLTLATDRHVKIYGIK